MNLTGSSCLELPGIDNGQLKPTFTLVNRQKGPDIASRREPPNIYLDP